MKIAVEGCAHGELEKIYECLETIQEREQIKIDLLICCGDFQSVRNKDDLSCMAVPEKYQNMCTFYKYYSGEKQAPVLTLFIGGNHEASNYLQELPYGGWVAPKVYYMGRAGVVNFGGLRIGGLSGIFKGRDYLQGLHECPPYTQSSLRSVYHVRALDVFRFRQIKESVNVMLSHDWPRGITNYGDKQQLLRRKPFLREDVESNQLGSRAAEELLNLLKPEYWFAAHLHAMFPAVVAHNTELKTSETKFLALDKCLPRRRHLQILEVPDSDKKVLKFDAEWLAILKNTNHLLVVKNINTHMPGPGGNERHDFTPSDEEKAAVIEAMGDMTINPNNFIRTAPIYTPDSHKGIVTGPIENPQTIKICEILGIDDPLQVVLARFGKVMQKPGDISEKIEPVAPICNTPQKNTKLFLPEPVTPLDCEKDDDSKVVNDSMIKNYSETRNDESVIENYSMIEDDSVIDNDSVIINYSEIKDDSKTLDDSFEPSNVSLVSAECTTPVSTKKTFKRRNQALYTPDVDNSQAESKSPKLPS